MIDILDRRALLALGTLMGAGAAMPALAEQETREQHMRRMMEIPPDAPKVAMLVYPKMVRST